MAVRVSKGTNSAHTPSFLPLPFVGASSAEGMYFSVAHNDHGLDP